MLISVYLPVDLTLAPTCFMSLAQLAISLPAYGIDSRIRLGRDLV